MQKFDDDAGVVANSVIHCNVFVVGGSYIGATGVLVNETDCRYKICLTTGKEVYLKKETMKFKSEDIHGDIANQLVKICYHFIFLWLCLSK
jgi:hypothetical protein